MSVDPTDEVLRPDDEELRDALIAYCRLSSEAVQRITEATRTTRSNFIEAAVHVGLVTSNEAAEALAWVRSTIARQHANVIETAVRRQSTSRGVAVRHSSMGKPDARLAHAYDLNSPHSEQIRALRTELLLLIETARQANCTAILSPCSGEGRSQLSAELAIAFSQLGRRTLLIDADLRGPTQHVLFGATVSWGLAQSLAHGDPPHLVGVEGLPFLTVLPAGPQVLNPLELISGGRFENLIRHSRNEYSYMVIDTPPVSRYADALTVASIAGNALLVSRAQATPYKEMKSMLRRLGPTQSRILGAVLHAF